MNTLREEEAIEKAATGWWKELSPKDIVSFQLYEDRLCMPFPDFHAAVAKALDDPYISTTAFAFPDGLRKAFERKYPEYKKEHV